MYNGASYMDPRHPQMQHMQMQQRQQMQMQQRQMQMQHQQRIQQQQQMQNQQHQQQIYQARKQQVEEKQQQRKKRSSDENNDDEELDDEDEDEDEDEDDEEEDDEDEDEDDDDSDESFSSLSDILSSSESDSGSVVSAVADKKRVMRDSKDSKSKSKTKLTNESSTVTKSKSKAKAKAKSQSKSKSKTDKAKVKQGVKAEAVAAAEVANAETEANDEAEEVADEDDANTIANEMQKLAMVNHVAPSQIPSSALSPGEYMFNVISDVLATNNKKNFQRILARTPLPIALRYLHQIAQRAFATGNRDIHKVVVDTNKKYNIVSDVFIDAFTKGESKSIYNAMTYLGKTVQAFNTAGAEFNTDELLKFFTPEFIAMNLIQSGNIEAYDRVMTEFKNEEIRISRGFHVAKALIAAYTGVPKFFSNQKRYTFTREIVILAICGGSTETLDYVMKKTKMAKMSHDIVLEARSCQPIPANMMKHLVEKYNVSEMSL